MSEELGKLEKPSVEEFKKGRKLFFVPLIFPGVEAPQEYQEKCARYWEQVERQLMELELKLGKILRIFHELAAGSGVEGANSIAQMNENSYQCIKKRLESGATFETTEDMDILTEFLDWSRCLSIGLNSQKAFGTIYQAYTESGKKRNEFIAARINDALKPDEIGLLFMREGHHVQFPPDVEIFYVAPPALDEIKKWVRDIESKPHEEEKPEEKK